MAQKGRPVYYWDTSIFIALLTNEQRMNNETIQVRGVCPECSSDVMLDFKETYRSDNGMTSTHVSFIRCEKCEWVGYYEDLDFGVTHKGREK